MGMEHVKQFVQKKPVPLLNVNVIMGGQEINVKKVMKYILNNIEYQDNFIVNLDYETLYIIFIYKVFIVLWQRKWNARGQK